MHDVEKIRQRLNARAGQDRGHVVHVAQLLVDSPEGLTITEMTSRCGLGAGQTLDLRRERVRKWVQQLVTLGVAKQVRVKTGGPPIGGQMQRSSLTRLTYVIDPSMMAE